MAEFLTDQRLDMTRLFAGYTAQTPDIAEPGRLAFDLDATALPPQRLEILGTGFAFDAAGRPTAGQVTSVTLVLDRRDPADPLARVDGLALPLAELLPDGPAGIAAGPFLAALLAGADTIRLGDLGIGVGDALEAIAPRIFADDRLELTGTDGILTGDVQTLRADAEGGDDILSATGMAFDGLRLVGDARNLVGARLEGGDDRLAVDAAPAPDSGFKVNTLAGDVLEMTGAATLLGGDDRLTGAKAIGDRLLGDVDFAQSPGGRIEGGADLLLGRGGADLLYGDVDNLAAGTLIGGDDTLKGGAGDDRLFGDAGRLTGGTLAQGGDDRLEGGSGADGLLGGPGADLLKGGGGNDTLLGEDGRDKLTGGPGADLLRGGLGKDKLLGGSGPDTFLWRAPDETIGDKVMDFAPGDLLDLSDLGPLAWVGDAYAGAEGTLGYTVKGAKLKLLANLDDDARPEVKLILAGLDALAETDLLL